MSKLSFEKALERLESIVEEMESGQLSLENALKKFEEGVKLSQLCTQKLNETEKKISLLMEQGDGTVVEKPFGEIDLDNEVDDG